MKNKVWRSLSSKIVIAVVIFLFWTSYALSHALGQSYLYLKIYDDAIDVRVEMTVKDLSDVLDLNLVTKQKRVKQEEVIPHIEQIKTYIAKNLKISDGETAFSLNFQNFDFLNTTFAQFLRLNYAVEGFQKLPKSLDISYDAILAEKPQHKNLVVIEENWKTGTFANESGVSLVFAEPGRPQTLDLSSGSIFRGFVGVVKLGMLHMLEGIDHVLFLAAFLLPAVLYRNKGRWQPVSKVSTALIYIVKGVTAFTVAHSITFWLGALQVVHMPSRLVESIIAASIGLVAVNIVYPIFRGQLWWAIFAFGIFHGFGFADVLAGLGVTSQHTVLSLFGFNLGIEVGQLVIIAVLLPLLYLIRNWKFYHRYALNAIAAGLGSISLYWFIERAFDINLQVLPTIQKLI